MNELAVRPTDDWVGMVEPLIQLSERLAMTVYAGPHRGKPAEVFATVLYGRELGLSPAQSLQMIHVIQGRPTLSAEGHRALFLSSGHRLDVVDWTDKLCTVRATRCDGRGSVEVTFTIKQAQEAGLLKNPSWRAYPQQMLLARATSMAVKAIAPDVSLGLEAQDAPMVEAVAPAASTTTVVQVAPASPTEPVEPVPPVQLSPVNVEPPPAIEAAPELVDDGLVTPAQLRKLNALLGELDRAEGRRLTRDERRELIGSLAGVDGLDSAKDLTRTQASTAIDQVAGMVAAILDAEQQHTEDYPTEEVPGGVAG